jgi:hypothetical protein
LSRSRYASPTKTLFLFTPNHSTLPRAHAPHAAAAAYVLSATKSGARGDSVLIAGPVGGGKSVLFYQLLRGSFQETHTSMKENIKQFAPRLGSSGDVDAPVRSIFVLCFRLARDARAADFVISNILLL